MALKYYSTFLNSLSQHKQNVPCLSYIQIDIAKCGWIKNPDAYIPFWPFPYGYTDYLYKVMLF